MVEKFRELILLHKTTVILGVVLIFLLAGGFMAFQKFSAQNSGPVEEVDLPFDSEGPYALLSPRKDGNALILKVLRTSSYDSISYDLAYTSNPDETVVTGGKQDFSKKTAGGDGEGESGGGSIDRGVSGTINTDEKRGEYEQEILFGTCSKNVCKYDKGVENGTLTLHIKKGRKAYKMVTQWRLQKPDTALGILNSLDSHFSYKTDAQRETLVGVAFSIINDLTGVPKLPSGKNVIGKVYALNVPVAKDLPTGNVIIELAENPASDSKIFRYNSSKNEWEELGTQIAGSKLTAGVNGGGIFAVLTSKK